MNDAVLGNTKLDAIRFVLTANILALMSIETGDIDNLGLVFDILLDLCDDHVFLMRKRFANDILKIVPQRSSRNIMTPRQGRCTDGLATNDLVLDVRAQVNGSSFGHHEAGSVLTICSKVFF